jgi:hypothetical protein
MRKLTLFILFLAAAVPVSAQQNKTTLEVRPLFNAQPVVPGKSILNPQTNDSLRIDVLRFYISNIRFYKNDSLVATDSLYHLVDMEHPVSLQIACVFSHPAVYDRIKFNIGVDSLTNVSGVSGGDLDPTKGMYWAWQSGYINFKLEGYSPQCKTRHQKFQYHLGGYMAPFATLQHVELRCPTGKNELQLDMQLDAFFNALDFSTCSEVMSPGEQALKLSGQLPSLFRIAK